MSIISQNWGGNRQKKSFKEWGKVDINMQLHTYIYIHNRHILSMYT